MPSEDSITDAKANFVTALNRGINVLMERCGYSRERAASALLRELSRGDNVRPSDQEMFETMRLYQLGTDEVTKALIVSKAFKRAAESCKSPAEAIQCLTSKISVHNLMYESSDEDPSVCDQDSSFRPELRIEPVSSTELKSSSRIKSTPIRKTKLAIKTHKSKLKTPTKGGLAGRKRSVEEMIQPCLPTRERSDSVNVEVDAKIAKKSNDEACSSDTMRSSSSVRVKRHRSDESDSNGPSSSIKRVLGADG